MDLLLLFLFIYHGEKNILSVLLSALNTKFLAGKFREVPLKAIASLYLHQGYNPDKDFKSTRLLACDNCVIFLWCPVSDTG